MINFLQNLFGGSSTERDIKSLQPIVDEINEFVERFKHLTDDELKAKTAEFKTRLYTRL